MKNRAIQNEVRSWLEQVEAILGGCAVAHPGSTTALLREANAVIRATPASLEPIFGRSIESGRFEMLLSAGALESAAIALLPQQVGYLFSRGQEGNCLASVVLPGLIEDVCVEGSNEALALLGAFLSAGLNLLDQHGSGQSVRPSASLSLN